MVQASRLFFGLTEGSFSFERGDFDYGLARAAEFVETVLRRRQ